MLINLLKDGPTHTADSGTLLAEQITGCVFVVKIVVLDLNVFSTSKHIRDIACDGIQKICLES